MTALDDVFDDDCDDDFDDDADLCNECGDELATITEVARGICDKCQKWDANER
jgi:hypothetical protein